MESLQEKFLQVMREPTQSTLPRIESDMNGVKHNARNLQGVFLTADYADERRSYREMGCRLMGAKTLSLLRYDSAGWRRAGTREGLFT